VCSVAHATHLTTLTLGVTRCCSMILKSFATIEGYWNWSGLSGHGWNTVWPIFLFYCCFGFLYAYLIQPTSRAYINDTSMTSIIAEPVVMDVKGPHHATLFHDLCGSSQLHKLLPEPFLVTENDVGNFFPCSAWLSLAVSQSLKNI